MPPRAGASGATGICHGKKQKPPLSVYDMPASSLLTHTTWTTLDATALLKFNAKSIKDRRNLLYVLHCTVYVLCLLYSVRNVLYSALVAAHLKPTQPPTLAGRGKENLIITCPMPPAHYPRREVGAVKGRVG